MYIVEYLCVYRVRDDFFCQAEDGIRDLVRSRGLGDVYKRQHQPHPDKGRDAQIGERITIDIMVKPRDRKTHQQDILANPQINQPANQRRLSLIHI